MQNEKTFAAFAALALPRRIYADDIVKSLTLYLIDGSSQMYRAFHAPVRTNEGGFLRNAQGRPTNAVYIFVTMLRKLLNEHKPEYIAASFDLPGRTFRDDLVTDYKANRAPMPDELASVPSDVADGLPRGRRDRLRIDEQMSVAPKSIRRPGERRGLAQPAHVVDLQADVHEAAAAAA